ncbi:hypothetical protein EJB05_29762 [Eragrostis curvula]|uniref:Uncharacterized protein n=1 Tax=Eragrostis curvula TaxID=38414 RepID=A0A5J9UUF7_9POAL|nr:hypothetical protein EJB05_29762 [Eragrostis curvula]
MKTKTKKMKQAKGSLNHRVEDCSEPGDDKVKSSTDYSKPVYLVAPPLSGQRAPSVFMVEAAALADGADPPPARTVAQIRGARGGMSFVATHSEQGSWIVGVGGPRGHTVIYDPSTMKTFEGPELSKPKHKPILISIGSKVYAISRRPKVHAHTKSDFEPWFESLSFSEGAPSITGENFRSWKTLPPPPFFPSLLDPLEFLNPPTISVSSYVAIGSHILLSTDCKETGTYAFDVVEEIWEKVCDDNLPFGGQAVALGGSLFAACCTIHNNFARAVTVFHMSIKSSSIPMASSKLATRVLSLHPVASERGSPLPLLCPTGKGCFCSIRLGSSCGNNLDRPQIILTAFKIDNFEAVLTACQTGYSDAMDLQVPVPVRHQNQTYLLPGPFQLKNSLMPVIASISMDKELAEHFEGERIKKRPREETVSNIFEAAVIRRT